MTSKATILLIAPELSTVSDDIFTQMIAYADNLVSLPACTYKEDMAKTYLASHLLTLAVSPTAGGVSPSGGAVKKERAGRSEIEYSDFVRSIPDANRYDSTKYGRLYNAVIRSCTDSLGVMVV